MILTIRHLAGSLSGKSQRIALKEGQVLRLGRAPESDVRFSETTDDTVSSVHAELSFDGQRLYVEDKRSANGTFVNGAPCPPFEKVAVPDGSRVRLAKQGPELQVVIESSRQAAGAAAATAATTATGAAQKQSVGRETLLREIGRARQEERDLVGAQVADTRRSGLKLLAAGLIGVVLLVAGGFGAWSLWDAKKTEARDAAMTATLSEVEDTADPWPAVDEKVSPAVVHIRCSYSIRAPNGNTLATGTSEGSGVQIRSGLVLTARHVVEDWRFRYRDPSWEEIEQMIGAEAVITLLEVQFPGQLPLTARLVSGAGDRTEDLALLQIQQTGAPAVEIGPTNSGVKRTEKIGIVGYPSGLGQYRVAASNESGDAGASVAELPEVVPTFIEGTVTQGLTSTGQLSHLLYFDASIEPGNSGGPVVNRQGQLIGIVSRQWRRREAVTINEVELEYWEPMPAGSIAVSPDDIHSFLRKHGIV